MRPAITDMEAVNRHLDQIRNIVSERQVLSAIEIDLMLDHTRRLYEAILQLREEQAPLTPGSNPIPVQLPEEAPVIIAAVPEEPPTPVLPEIAPEPEPDLMIEEELLPYVSESVETGDLRELEKEPEAQPGPIPASTTAAETYSNKLTSFHVSGKDIRMYIGINDKYNFISELFGSNNEAYEEILDEINTFETKEDALFFLSNSGVTTLYHWDEESFSVRIFHNVLNQFFSAR